MDTQRKQRGPGRPPKPGSPAWARQQAALPAPVAPPAPASDPPRMRILGDPGPAPAIPPGTDVVRIYALAGADNRYHYAGITRQPLEGRLAGHLATARRGAGGPVGDWLRGELDGGHTPTIHHLDTLYNPTPHRLHQAEQGWIAGLLAGGEPLCNVAVDAAPAAVVPVAVHPPTPNPQPTRPSPLAPRPSRRGGWAWGLAAALVLLAVGAVWWQGRPVAAGPILFSPPVAVAPAPSPTAVAQALVEVPPDQARTVSGAPPAMAQAAPPVLAGPVDLPVSTGALAAGGVLAAAQAAGLPTGGLTLPDAAPAAGGGGPPPVPSPTHVSVEHPPDQPVHRPQRLPPTGVPMPPALPVVRAIPAPTPTPRQSVETHDQAVHHTKP